MGKLSPTYDVRYDPELDLSKVLSWWRVDKNPEFRKEWNEKYDNYFYRLIKSIKEEGVKVPLIVTVGGGDYRSILKIISTHCDNNSIEFPFKTTKSLIYPELLDEWYIAVNRGCARVWAAQRAGLSTIPAIILDFNNSHSDLEEITSTEQLMSKIDPHFRSQIHNVEYNLYDITYFIHIDDEYNF